MASLPTRSGVVPGARPLRAGGLIAVCASIALSVLSYGILPEPMRIHWQFGYGPYYGPEFAPTAVVLAAFPVALTGILVGSSLLARKLREDDSFEAIRPYYEWAVLAVLAFALLAQLVIIRLNLG
jgi:uncharacterized membrane protein